MILEAKSILPFFRTPILEAKKQLFLFNLFFFPSKFRDLEEDYEGSDRTYISASEDFQYVRIVVPPVGEAIRLGEEQIDQIQNEVRTAVLQSKDIFFSQLYQ